MASLFKQKKSKYWWIKFRDPLTNEIKRESTGYRIGNGPETRKASELEAQKTLAERESSGNARKEQWDAWVAKFIVDRYGNSPDTFTRYHTAWRTIRMFLTEKEIHLPRQLTYHHCLEYIKWREEPNLSIGKYRAGRNTAILEIKFLGVLMKYAVNVNFAVKNPCRELGLRRDKVKRFPKLTPEDNQLIVDGIYNEPELKRKFLWPSFLVSYYHGVRLRETAINPKRAITLSADGKNDTIIFFQKGGKVRIKPLHPELRDFFLERRNHEKLFDVPKSFAKEWHNFLHRCGLKALKSAACFHSLRVTVTNRLRSAGVPKEIRKAYLSHDFKEDVNAGYNRVDGDEDIDPDDIEAIDLEEMRQCHAPLNRTFSIPAVTEKSCG